MSNGDLKFTRHALEQSEKRQITLDEIASVLATGHLAEDGDRAETRIGFVSRPDGARRVGVVSRVEANGDVVVITVFWVDPAKWNADFTKRVK